MPNTTNLISVVCSTREENNAPVLASYLNTLSSMSRSNRFENIEVTLAGVHDHRGLRAGTYPLSEVLQLLSNGNGLDSKVEPNGEQASLCDAYQLLQDMLLDPILNHGMVEISTAHKNSIFVQGNYSLKPFIETISELVEYSIAHNLHAVKVISPA